MNRLQALVLDFDGTVVDTETPDYQSWLELYHRHGVDLPLSVWARAVGSGPEAFDPMAHLEERVGRPLDRESLAAARRARDRELSVRQGPMPGVVDLLDQARRCGIPVGLASNSHREHILWRLEKFGLLDRFHCFCTADDVERVKPDPSLYLLALERLDADPTASLAVEDSPNGVRAARAAGMRCLAVPNGITRHFAFPPVDARIDSLEGVDLTVLWPTLVSGGDTNRAAGEGGAP